MKMSNKVYDILKWLSLKSKSKCRKKQKKLKDAGFEAIIVEGE